MIEDQDLQLAYRWFIHYDGSKLNPEIGKKLREVKDVVGTGAFDLVKQIGNDLVSSNPHPDQAGEIKLIVALITLDGKIVDIEKFFVARDLIENSASYFYETYNARDEKYFHYLSIFAWLRGYINWHIGKNLEAIHIDPRYLHKRTEQYRGDAIAAWLFCVRVLNELSYSYLVQEPGWYQEVRWKVVESLYETRRRDQYQGISPLKLRSLPAEAVKPAHPRPERRAPPTKKRRPVIPPIPVYQHVPAGGWGVVEPDEIGYVETDELTIEGVPHQAFDLSGRGQVVLKESERYALVHITGTSMNKRDIQPEDYVLIRRQEDAEHNDLVLAARLDIDPEATLKRLHKQGNIIELHPDSYDSHPILSLQKRDQLSILGIAIAVLKPVSGEDQGEE